MHNKKIAIWTEGGPKVGMGHVSRSLYIAEALAEKGIEPLFFIDPGSSSISRIESFNFPYAVCNIDNHKQVLNLLKRQDIKTILVDSKKPIESSLGALKESGYKIVLVDNATGSRFLADVNIYPAAHFQDSLPWDRYKGKVFTGAKYVPLSRKFIEARKNLKPITYFLPLQILISMGGSDLNHVTGKVLQGLRNSDLPIEITTVLGPDFVNDTDINAIKALSDPRFFFLENLSDLSGIISKSHIAFTAMGTTINELAVLGVPSIIIANYLNDETDLKKMTELGVSITLGHYKDISKDVILNAIEVFISNKSTWQEMRERAYNLIDGQGAHRIAEILHESLMQ